MYSPVKWHKHIDGCSLFHAEFVPSFSAALLVLICKHFLGVPTDTLPVPEFLGKIHPFFMPIRISGSTFEQRVDTGKGSIQQGDQIVFEIDFQLYVLIVLAATRFKNLPDLINRSVMFEISPTAKTVISNFHSVQLIRICR